MDPITAAIIAAISSGMAEVGKESVLDAYKALKSLLSRKFGSHSQVIKAVEDLERNPSSQARTAVLQEEVTKAKADQDPDLLRAAYSLSQQVNYSSVSRSNQVAYGPIRPADEIYNAKLQERRFVSPQLQLSGLDLRNI